MAVVLYRFHCHEEEGVDRKDYEPIRAAGGEGQRFQCGQDLLQHGLRKYLDDTAQLSADKTRRHDTRWTIGASMTSSK